MITINEIVKTIKSKEKDIESFIQEIVLFEGIEEDILSRYVAQEKQNNQKFVENDSNDGFWYSHYDPWY